MQALITGHLAGRHQLNFLDTELKTLHDFVTSTWIDNWIYLHLCQCLEDLPAVLFFLNYNDKYMDNFLGKATIFLSRTLTINWIIHWKNICCYIIIYLYKLNSLFCWHFFNCSIRGILISLVFINSKMNFCGLICFFFKCSLEYTMFDETTVITPVSGNPCFKTHWER